jgi:hypothetical protein
MILTLEPFSRVYIAGPITHMQDGNRAAFEDMERKIVEVGCVALNPHKFGFGELDTHETCMRGCLWRLTSQAKPVSLLVALAGWQHSKGATFEVATARVVGIAVVSVDDSTEIMSTFLGLRRRSPSAEEPAEAGCGWLL